MRNFQGFTIIELMITLVILGVGIGALTYLQTRTDKITKFSEAQHIAMNLANDKLDDWHSMTYDAIGVGVNQSDSISRSNINFSRVWNVTEYTNPTYKVMNVFVSWADAGGSTHTIKLATSVARTSLAHASN